MAALTKGRKTSRIEAETFVGPVAAATTIFTGAILMRDASGNLVEGQTATGLTGVGVAYEDVDNSAGAAGDLTVTFRNGTFRFDNSAAADEITAADIGGIAYAVDDQTVAKTSATNTRSAAGTIVKVDAQGVWVRFDEQLTTAAVAAGV